MGDIYIDRVSRDLRQGSDVRVLRVQDIGRQSLEKEEEISRFKEWVKGRSKRETEREGGKWFSCKR